MIIPGKYIWRSAEVDYPVTVIENLGKGPDDRVYLKIKESLTAIPLDEIVFWDQKEKSRKPAPKGFW